MSTSGSHALMNDERVMRWLGDTLRRHFDPSEPKLQFPSRGARTPVAIARWESRGVVAKLFHSPTRFLNSTYHLRYMRAHDLPVPELLYWSVASRIATPRAYLAVEELVPGCTLEDLPESSRLPGLDSVGRALARLHGRRRRSWGRVGFPRAGSYVDFYLPIARTRVARLTGVVPDETLDRLVDGLAAAASGLSARASHALLHAHVNMGNFLVAEDACLIDVGSAHYGDPARDLVRAVHRLCRGAEEAARLLDVYFSAAIAGSREAFDGAEAFYACDYIVRKTRKMADRLALEGEVDQNEIRKRVDAQIGLCFDLLSGRGPRFHELWPELG